MAKKKTTSSFLVKLYGELKMFDHRDRPVKKPEHLKLLDQFYTPDSMVQYIYHPSLSEIKIAGGFLRCQFDSKTKKLFLITDFGFEEKPTKVQLAALKDECSGQWSDGLGESAFDSFSEMTGFSVETCIRVIKVEQSKGKPFVPVAKSKAQLKKLATAWKKAGKQNAPTGDKAILEKCFKAIENKSVKQLKAILEKHNVDLDAVMSNRSSHFDEETLLTYATFGPHCHVPSVKLLLSEGADPNALNSNGLAPLHRAGTARVVQLLLAGGADPNVKTTDFSMTPLMQAFILAVPESVELLLCHGAKPNAKNSFKSSPLQAAAKINVDSARLLLKHGAKPTAKCLDDSFHPDDFFGAGDAGITRMALLFIDAGVKPKREHLVEAAGFGLVDLAAVLLKRKLPLNKLGSSDVQIEARKISPLTRAIYFDEPKMVKFLLSQGADPNLGKGKERPICVAIEADSLSMLKTIVAAGGTLAPFDKKSSLSQYAKQLGSKKVIAYLEKHEPSDSKATKSEAKKKVAKKKTVKKKATAKRKKATAKPKSKSGARRFEFSEGKSNKFWTVAQAGREFTVTYGRIGTGGQSKTKSLADKAACDTEVQKLIDQKTSRGYKEI